MPEELLTQSEIDAKAAAAIAADAEAPEVEAEPTEAVAPIEGAGSEAAAGDEDKPAKHKKGGFVRRIERLETELEVERQQKKELLDRLAGKPAEAQKSKADDADPEPTEAEFTDYKDFIKATARWTVRQEQKSQSVKAQTEATEKRNREVFETFKSRVDEFRETHEDFDDVTGADIQIYDGVRQVLYELDNGPEIVYYLGKNPTFAKKLMDMGAVRAMAEIGKLSVSLDKPKSPVNGKTRTTAPAPITPVSGGSAANSGDPAKMTMAEYRKWREAQQSA